MKCTWALTAPPPPPALFSLSLRGEDSKGHIQVTVISANILPVSFLVRMPWH